MELFEVVKKIPILDIARDVVGINVVRQGTKWGAICPFHDDTNPSLFFDEVKNTWKCFGCDRGGSGIDLVIEAGRAATPKDAAVYLANWYGFVSVGSLGGGGTAAPGPSRPAPPASAAEKKPSPKGSKGKKADESPPYSLAHYAEEKALPIAFLSSLGLKDYRGNITIPYFDQAGKEVITRYRRWKRFWWPAGSDGKLCLYGLNKLQGFLEKHGYLVMVEGESDSQTLWLHDYPALGVPGAKTFSAGWVEILKPIKRIYIHREPDEGGSIFLRRTANALLETGYTGEILVFSLEGHKDSNELHKANSEGFKAAFDAAMAGAVLPQPEDLKEKEPDIKEPSRPRTLEEVLEAIKNDPLEVFHQPVLGALAALPAASLAILKASIKSKVSISDLNQAIKEEKRRQRIHLRVAGTGEGPEAPTLQGIMESCPVDLPVPEGWTFSEQGIFKLVTRQEEAGMFQSLEKQFPVPVVLSCVQVPMDSAGDESLSYEISWLNNTGNWHKTAFPAETIFDRARLTHTASVGIPVDSENSRGLLRWLAALRDTRQVPSKKVVVRCGWHKDLFVLGNRILKNNNITLEEEGDKVPLDSAETTAEINSANKRVDWTSAVRGNEKELVGALKAGGDPDKQEQILLHVIKKYPLAGFLIGTAAAAPLLRLLYAAGRLEIHGFIVEVASDQAGVGKTTGQELAASVFGNPGHLVRTFDRTTVAWEVLLHTMCDCPVFMEEAQIQSKEDKAAQLVYALALGMGRERGNRSGGMRITRQFFNTVLLASERSLKTFTAREGVEARVISLPPVFGEKSPERGNELRRLRSAYFTHYGHAGQKYMQLLIERVSAGGMDRLLELFEYFCKILESEIPLGVDGEAKSVAMRMATRVAASWLGLSLLLQSMGMDEMGEAYELSFMSAVEAWKHIVSDLDTVPIWKKALAVIQSYAAENAHRIAGMEIIGIDGRPRIPSGGYIGGLVTVGADPAIGFFPNALDDAIKRFLGIEGPTVRKGLIREGVIIPDGSGKSARTQRIRPIGGDYFSARVICVPKGIVFPEELPGGAFTDDDVPF